MHALAALFNTRQYAQLELQAQACVQRFPASGFAWKVLGAALQMQGKAALEALQHAARLLPYDAEANSNLGVELRKLGRTIDAADCYRRALAVNPQHAQAHSNLGSALLDLGQIQAASDAFRTALQLKPELVTAASNLLCIQNYRQEQPADKLLAEAQRFGAVVARQARTCTDWPNNADPERVLRVGLVSSDLREHPVGYFLESVLAALAANTGSRLQLLAYATHARSDALTARLQACCSQWCAAHDMTDDALARRIQHDGVDILVDLAGHTAFNRLALFAWKPAPLQLSWLGYFATTGVAQIDYLLADPHSLPPDQECHFTETIWRLPDTRLCFTAPHADLPVSGLPALQNGFVTFGCFNNLAKMTPAVMALWADILRSLPGSRLLLKNHQLDSHDRQAEVLQAFAAQGIAPERLALEGAVARDAYLAAYHRVDIALDPFPYPGGTITAEALWMGVPVITLAGESFLSRQGVGLLTNAGLGDWVAPDSSAYRALALSRAADLQHLAQLRANLRTQVLASPLFDAPRFARHWEDALRQMWRLWCSRRTGAAGPGPVLPV